MKKILITLLVISVIAVAGCIQNITIGGDGESGSNITYNPPSSCPDSCDDGDDCTRDWCSMETDFKCAHKDFTPCCGNDRCEPGESYVTCSDCRYTLDDEYDFVMSITDVETDWDDQDKGILESIDLKIENNADIDIVPVIGMQVVKSVTKSEVYNEDSVSLSSYSTIKAGEDATIQITEQVNLSADTAYTVRVYLYDESDLETPLTSNFQTFTLG
jgi:hypothetical protein